jgi:hypothetical protein
MADEAFALSPISARATQPSEADYDAIQEAFMETSRGRWFLGEYAKRNRNSDTKMVLDAVARIEETISASRKPVRDPLVDEALAALRAALTEARDAANAAVSDLALDRNLAPVRKGARVIQEIAWRLREIGADGRICDLIDSQVAAIEGAAAKLSPADLADALSGAFDRIEGKVAAFNAEDAAASSAPPEAKAPTQASDATSSTPSQAAPAAAETPVQEREVGGTAQASSTTSEIEPKTEASIAEPGRVAADELPIAAAPEEAGEPIDAFDAGDEALLDMVALEMAAPDTDAAYEPKIEDAEIYESQLQANQTGDNEVAESEQESQPASRANGVQAGNIIGESAGSWEIDVTFGSDAGEAVRQPAMATALPTVTPLQPAREPEPVTAPEPEPALSLGSSLLANGIVSRPRASRPDPLAPIRRMSQNEKIAFFS